MRQVKLARHLVYGEEFVPEDWLEREFMSKHSIEKLTRLSAIGKNMCTCKVRDLCWELAGGVEGWDESKHGQKRKENEICYIKLLVKTLKYIQLWEDKKMRKKNVVYKTMPANRPRPIAVEV